MYPLPRYYKRWSMINFTMSRPRKTLCSEELSQIINWFASLGAMTVTINDLRNRPSTLFSVTFHSVLLFRILSLYIEDILLNT